MPFTMERARQRHAVAGLAVLTAGLVLSQSLAGEVPEPASDQLSATIVDGWPMFETSRLNTGRPVWLENCRSCHERGIAGAPIVTAHDEWAFRLTKGMPVLYEHAINGFFGDDDTMMPAKGGNEALSNEQVQSAVDYMVAIVIFFHQRH